MNRAGTMNDTHPRIAALQLELIRSASTQKRLELMDRYSGELIALSQRTINARVPDAMEAKLEWVRLNYGLELAERLRKHLYATP
jgi:hypothetical protein